MKHLKSLEDDQLKTNSKKINWIELNSMIWNDFKLKNTDQNEEVIELLNKASKYMNKATRKRLIHEIEEKLNKFRKYFIVDFDETSKNFILLSEDTGEFCNIIPQDHICFTLVSLLYEYLELRKELDCYRNNLEQE